LKEINIEKRRNMASIRKRGDTFQITVSMGVGVDGLQIRKFDTFTPPKDINPKKARKLAEEHAYKNVIVRKSVVEVQNIKIFFLSS
jgi:hypothetical protein